MIWCEVDDGKEMKRLAFLVVPRQGEVISAAISTPGPHHHRVMRVTHMSMLHPQILVARIEGGGNDN
jgi:hypothetical protein